MSEQIGRMIEPRVACSPTVRVEFMKANSPEVRGVVVSPRTWYFKNDPTETAPYIVCPRCGQPGRLENHVIDIHGMIEPSVVCPLQNCGDGVRRCDAHYYGHLTNWVPR